MAFQPVPDTASITLAWDRGGDWPVINRHHFRDTTTPWSIAHLTEMVNDVQAWWEASLRPLTAQNLRLKEIKAVDLETENGNQVAEAFDDPGTASGISTSAIVSAVISWRGDAGGFPRRGRTYFGGLTELQYEGDALLASVITDLQAAYDDLRGAPNPLNAAALVLVSRFSGTSLVSHPDGTVTREPTPRVTGVTNTIQSVACQAVLGSQQRRRRGG